MKFLSKMDKVNIESVPQWTIMVGEIHSNYKEYDTQGYKSANTKQS